MPSYICLLMEDLFMGSVELSLISIGLFVIKSSLEKNERGWIQETIQDTIEEFIKFFCTAPGCNQFCVREDMDDEEARQDMIKHSQTSRRWQ